MQQLHAKGLVQILPEKPLRYKAVPFANYLKSLAEDYRSRARRLATSTGDLAREFRVSAVEAPELRGRFEAIYGRRNVRDKLLEMYEHAESEIIAIGSTHSPARIVRGLGPDLEEKAASGVSVKLAFCVQPENGADIRVLSRYAEVRHIDFFTPVTRHGVDGRQFLMSHPIPDDDHPFRGEDIAIWTDDAAIALAMAQMAQKIWEVGKPAATALRAGPKDEEAAAVTPSAAPSGGQTASTDP